MVTKAKLNGAPGSPDSWDHGSHADFYEYYAAESQSASTLQRFRSVRAVVLRVAAQTGLTRTLDVADIGCGAGTQARLWAELGHRVRGLDVNEPLIQLARQRAQANGLEIPFEVGRGLLYLSTTNVLCPIQQEFRLPAYSWYPGRPLERYCERLAVTTRPTLANYAKYPAIHWFSFYRLRDFLKPLGFRCLDRFDLIDTEGKGRMRRLIVTLLRHVALFRFLSHVATPSTYLVAAKH